MHFLPTFPLFSSVSAWPRVRARATVRFLQVACVGLVLLAAATARGETEPALKSMLTGARLPANALRLHDDSVPDEVIQALRNLIAAGGERAVQGDAETLAWTGDGFRRSKVPAMIRSLTDSLAASGWIYEVGGNDGDLTVFSLHRTAPTRRALLGFYTSSDDALVLAWTELLVAPAAGETMPGNATAIPVVHSPARSVPVPAPAVATGATVVQVDASALHVNVMGREMPAMPKFPDLDAKPGMIRGFVYDINGRPIEGAAFGVRSTAVGGFYSGSQGESDADGYYEFPVPSGVAHFYNAGCTIDWSDGAAALSLHPVDGKLSSFASTQGAVENFVLLPYGITSRENLSETPHLPSTYYGGALYIGHWTRTADDVYAPRENLIEGSMVEILLTPEGPMLGGAPGRSFVVRRPASGSGYRINNIPLGTYQIQARLADGTPLKMSLNKPRNSPFGITPTETIGAARLVLAPDGARASGVTPNYGSWSAVEIYLELP